MRKHKIPWLWYWSPLSYALLILVAPYYLYRMWTTEKYREGLRQRLGRYRPDEIKSWQNRRFIWVHTVSVGELQAARPLLRRLKETYPNRDLFITTVTQTGQELARSLDEVDACMYLPLDLYPLCRRAMKRIRPEAVIILETELWPNFLRAAARQGGPIYLVNARLSDTSFKNYKYLRFLFRPLLACFDWILTQSERDRERFLALGVAPDRAVTAGNIKFEAAPQVATEDRQAYWKSLFQIQEGETVLLGGSLFPGEDNLMVQIFRELQLEQVDVRLIVAPRHLNRCDRFIHETDPFSVVRRTELDRKEDPLHPNEILLLDTMGELRSVYAVADIVVMGKSLLCLGGQNPIEPAAWGKPILFGRHMENFRDVATLFIEGGGAIQVETTKELKEQIKELCMEPAKRRQMGERARHVVESNRGVLDNLFLYIRVE